MATRPSYNFVPTKLLFRWRRIWTQNLYLAVMRDEGPARNFKMEDTKSTPSGRLKFDRSSSFRLLLRDCKPSNEPTPQTKQHIDFTFP